MATGAITVELIESHEQLDEMFDFAEKIYADDPVWFPPLRALMRRRLSPKNPLFESAEIKLFLARDGGSVVGSISALRDFKHEKYQGEKATFFGFFECIDDDDVARALVDRVVSQAEAWGSTMLRGPRNLSRSEEVGVVIDGTDKQAPILASHNKSRYVAQLEALGFEKHHDILAYDIDLYDENGQPAPYPEKLLKRAQAVDIPDLELHPARWPRILKDLKLAHRVFVEAFRDVPDNTPMSLPQFTSMGLGLLFFSNRHMLQLATVRGEPAGFALCFPEMNEAIRVADGELLPNGWLNILLATRNIKTASFKLIGVMPDYRHSGLHALMIVQAVDGTRKAGYQRIEASLIDERNVQSRGVVEGIGMAVYKRWRMFQREV